MGICSCETTIIAIWFLTCRNNQFNRNRERENMAKYRSLEKFNLEPQCFLISTIQLMQKLIHTHLCLRTHLQDDKLVFMILYYFGCEIIYIPYIQHSKFWGFSYQGCIYMIKNTVRTVILWNIIAILNNCFPFKYIRKGHLFLWCKAEFSAAITPVLGVTVGLLYSFVETLILFSGCTDV